MNHGRIFKEFIRKSLEIKNHSHLGEIKEWCWLYRRVQTWFRKRDEFAGKWKRLLHWRSKMNQGRIFKEFIRKSLEMKHRDMFKLLEGEDGHVVVVVDDDDDDVTCCLPLRRRRTLLTPHHQSAQKRARIEAWMFLSYRGCIFKDAFLLSRP